MLRALIATGSVVIAAGVGGIIWYNMECSGGTIVRNSWQCVRNAGFQPEFCNSVFASEEDAMRRAPVYATEQACLSAYRNCAENKRPAGWLPRPSSYCVTTGSGGQVTSVQRV